MRETQTEKKINLFCCKLEIGSVIATTMQRGYHYSELHDAILIMHLRRKRGGANDDHDAPLKSYDKEF